MQIIIFVKVADLLSKNMHICKLDKKLLYYTHLKTFL